MTSQMSNGCVEDINPTIYTQSRLTAIFHNSRRSKASNELYIQIVECHEPVLYLELWFKTNFLGYARLERCMTSPEIRQGYRVYMFALAELLSANSPTPHPVVALSGVLWNRQELFSELQGPRASLFLEGLPDVFDPLPGDGSPPRES